MNLVCITRVASKNNDDDDDDEDEECDIRLMRKIMIMSEIDFPTDPQRCTGTGLVLMPVSSALIGYASVSC